MRQSVCLDVNPIKVCSYVSPLNCMTVGQVTDSATALTLSLNRLVGTWCLSLAGSTVAQLEISLALAIYELFSMFHNI